MREGAVYAAAAIILPVSEAYAFLFTYGGFYTVYFMLACWMSGLVLRLGMPGRRFFRLVLLFLLGIWGGLAGVRMLMICGLYQLFGEYFETVDGTRLDGIGVIGAYTVGQNVRMIGNLVEHSDQFGDVIGYENHSGQTFLREGVQPLGTVNQDGRGNNGEDHTEGARVHNVIGTYMHGSLLPKNPAISDFLIETAVTRRYGTFDTSDQTPEQAKELARLDQVATNARKAAAERPR